MKTRLILAALFAFALFNAAAQTLPIQSASVDELVDKLASPEPSTRSLGDTRNLAPQPRKIDLVVQFDFGSARLQEASKPLLSSLAQAMGTERIKSLRFRVEGHTDAVGRADYNVRLSENRAQSVMGFLMQHGVEKDRLTALGKGATELLLPDQPEATANRRVRITTLN